MDRLTKLVVLVSTALAFALLVDLNNRANPILLPLAAAAFAVACLAEAIVGELALGGVLFFTCLAPALYLATAGILFRYTYASPWLAALLGVIVVRSARTPWSFPRPFKAPLVLWALGLALTWPILVARELDFTPALLYRFDVGSSRSGIPPPVAIEWLLYVTCTASIGLLTLDWLFGAYGRRGLERFESHVGRPLLAGALIGSIVGVYQWAGHVGFLNPTVYGGFGRAAGTMLDANVFGTVLALWLPVAGARWLDSVSKRSAMVAWWTVVLLLMATALWATGSRTALLLGVTAIAVFAAFAWPTLRLQRGVVLGAAAAILVVAGIVLLRAPSAVSPLDRLRLLTGNRSPGALHDAVFELWRRNGYGTAATQVVIEHPLVGIGAGGFNVQAADAIFRRSGQPLLSTDNAQNWYRHQLAELGLLGSIGWIAWTGLVARTLVRGRPAANRRPLVGATVGALLGFGLASIFGMPAQDAAVWITFVVFAFWCLRLKGVESAESSDRASHLHRWQWVAIVLIAATFAAGTAWAARADLRPPYRALAGDWPYQYGFFDYDNSDRMVRWTGKRAVDVFPAGKRWLKLVIGGGPPDGPPLEVTVRRDRDEILRFASSARTSVTKYVRTTSPGRMLIEIAVNRVWRPSDYGQFDNRSIGVRVDRWSFVDEPPAGADRVE